MSRWWQYAPLLAIGLFFSVRTQHAIYSADLWWQLRTGQLIAAQHAVPTVDQLSYSVPQHSWIELRWIYCLCAYGLYQIGGAAALIVMQGCMLAAATAAAVWLGRFALRTGAGQMFLLLALVAASARFVVRPELVTYLLVPVFLHVLGRHERSKVVNSNPARRAIWLLPLLQVFWTNAHTLFVFGPIIAWCFAAGATIERLWTARSEATARSSAPSGRATTRRMPWLDRQLTAVALCVTAACLVNPYGWHGALFPLTLAGEIHKDSILGSQIQEFRSPFNAEVIWTIETWSAALLAAVTAMLFLRRWQRGDLARFVIFAGTLYSAAISTRNIGLFAFCAMHIGVVSLAWRRDQYVVAVHQWPGREWLSRCGSLTAASVAAFLAWAVASDRYYDWTRSRARTTWSVVESTMTTGNSAFMLRHLPVGEVFNGMSDGSYLTWALRDHYRVFLDGRLEVYGEAFVEDYLKILSGDWEAKLRSFNVNTILASRHDLKPLVIRLLDSKEWALVCLDHRGFLFLRRIPEHADLIATTELQTRQTTSTIVSPTESLPRWKELIGGRPQVEMAMGLANNWLLVGAIDNAAAVLRGVLEVSPGHVIAARTLAAIALADGDTATANALAIDSNAVDPTSRQVVAMAVEFMMVRATHAYRRDEFQVAATYLERVTVTRPDDVKHLCDLGVIYLKISRLDDAERVFTRCLELEPLNSRARGFLEEVRFLREATPSRN